MSTEQAEGLHSTWNSRPFAHFETAGSSTSSSERGDYSRVDWAEPDIEFAWIDGLSPGRWIGLLGMSEGMREMLSAWRDHRVIAETFTEVDAEQVLVTVRTEGRGRISGIEAKDVPSTRRGADVFRVRGGRVTAISAYWDCDRALADLGLEK